MPIPRFRTGPLRACPCFLAAIPRQVMITAIIRHCATEHRDGQAVRTVHAHGNHRFRIETAADRAKTDIRLA